MSLDRVIRWTGHKHKPPNRLELRRFLTDYVGAAGKCEWRKGVFFVTLIGKPSLPFKRLATFTFPDAVLMYGDERWIEVWPEKKFIYIVTRRQDEFTNAIAAGMTKAIARFWQGRIETN